MLSETFFVAFIATMSGMIIKLASMAYKSKCKEVSFCCLKIVRDTETEQEELEFRIKNNVKGEEDKNSV